LKIEYIPSPPRPLSKKARKVRVQGVFVPADMQAFKAMMRRETTLMQRTFFVYIFKAVQVRP